MTQPVARESASVAVLATVCGLIAGLCGNIAAGDDASPPPVLPGTQPLEWEGDLAARMIAGVDRFLLAQTEESIEKRAVFWNRDCSSADAYERSVEPNRRRFTAMIGLRDQRPAFNALELLSTSDQSALVGRGEGYDVFAVRWPALDGVTAEGLWLEPTDTRCIAQVVAIPDCRLTPEAIAGLDQDVEPESQYARRLVENGCRVLIPVLINRNSDLSVIAGGQRTSQVSHREILYRAAYQMGRLLIGYEVQKVLAAVDWFEKQQTTDTEIPIAVVGHGEGGLIALYAGAADPRIDVTGVSGYFNSRQQLWREPIDRNVFGLLREFGDAEIASLIAPHTLIVEASAVAGFEIPSGTGRAPGSLSTPPIATVREEVQRANQLVAELQPPWAAKLVESGDGGGPCGSEPFLRLILQGLGRDSVVDPGSVPTNLRADFDPHERLARQFHEIAEFSQRLVEHSDEVRHEFTKKINRDEGISAFEQSTEPYREIFRTDVIGSFDDLLPLPPNARSRLLYDEPDYTGYEVVLDVFDEVVFYGILLLPKQLNFEHLHPVVVCQHGLEGRAQFTVNGDYTSYRDFASRLASRGYVVVAPQHLYRGGDDFRTLQRKANPLKKSLFAVMVAQHRQLLAWLSQQTFVDPRRVAFYGISYGGKSAMRIPALLDGYCLSICSSDFSDWIWRTVTNRFPGGYLAHGEYEIFEFNLGNTFNYAEMAALICPRPFMVERFHHHGLFAERTLAEFSQVELLYENLGIADRVAMAYFGSYGNDTPYEDRETFEFLDKHLRPDP